MAVITPHWSELSRKFSKAANIGGLFETTPVQAGEFFGFWDSIF
jgi:hypothetical protein